MLTRLGYYADRVLEMGWLAAAVLVPLFFNVYSSRVFEPDKISLLRSIALIMVVAWLVKLAEGGYRAVSQSGASARSRQGMTTAVQGAAESGLPSWLGFLRVPMIVPIATYALVYLITSIFSVTPQATIFGSYQRLQGTFSQYSYMFIGLMVIANMRNRKQMERLISFMILTSVPVAVYGLLQANRLDPLPWAGDTATRVASSMGNAIFVAAWLIIVVPFTLYRFMLGINSMFSRRDESPAPDGRAASSGAQDGRGAVAARQRTQPARYTPDYSWAVVSIVTAILLSIHFYFFFALHLVSGLPFPEAQLWFMVPSGLILFYGACWAIEWLSNHRDEPMLASVLLPIAGGVVLLTSFLAFVPTWTLNQDLTITTEFSGAGFLWVIFFSVVAWGGITAISYLLGGPTSAISNDPNRGIIATTLTVAYGFLLVIQVVCIYLTQSRGPWLGIGVGLVVFAVALWLVGRRRDISWMRRIGGVTSALVLVGVIFIGVLNIPESPLQALGNAPLIGKGVERLSTLFRTEDGTGKVRTLIWQGASKLIASDPVRTFIGWGPESMYVVYNRFYPADLAHWELRNATPDRSHNVEFDHLVTMGVVGLLAYYFMLAAFFFYAVKILKRTTSIRDILLTITLMSALLSHFVEIQTGIQIAATWTYFYLIIGMMVAYGYYITGYLREEAPAVAQPVRMDGLATDGAIGAQRELPVGAGAASVAAARQTGTFTAQKAVAAGGNGKTSNASTTGVKPRPQTAGQGSGSRPPGQKAPYNSGKGQQGGQTPDARRRQAQAQAYMRGPGSTEWMRSPAMLIVYAVALVLAVMVIFSVNVANVQADTLYKQGQSYDGAARWTDSIVRYQKAIALQPDQDYYYLFLGRAYLEWAKLATKEMTGLNNPTTNKPYTQDEMIKERNLRLNEAVKWLSRAKDLNPRNTDHYANLGRLYLYWSDTGPDGGGDPSKAVLAVENMEKATENSPGNAQLWDELAVAYARNGQFDKGVQALLHSQNEVDNTYSNTPFIRGQLFEERADNVKNALQAGKTPPPGGETDYGKLVIEAAKAFSESIALNPGYFVDNGMQARVDWLLDAATPFTGTNTTVPADQLGQVLTTTIIQAYKNNMKSTETLVTETLTKTGALKANKGDIVPTSLLEDLWSKPQWAGINPGGQFKEWHDAELLQRTRDAVIPYAAMGYIYFRLGDRAKSVDAYHRGVALDPSNYFNQKNYGSLLADGGKVQEGLDHLNTALQIILTYPDVNTDPQKSENLNSIKSEIDRVQKLPKP
ncbi:MAG: O-antigen ligase family protein [Chloroflexia bacterium]